ncbi:MAG: cation:proton antiporter [Pseudomonadota bacterium]
MTTIQWFLLIGFLLLARGLSSTILQRSPFTSSIFYLAVGLIAGPTVLGLFKFDPLEQSALLEALTEVAVLISLFSAGVKMPVPVKMLHWRPPIRLAWISMTITVALVAGFGYYVLDLPLGAGILLGAILAPTDPVLATDVQSRHHGDKDQLRFTLTSEAGMNDGTAFPFVMLGLGLLGLHELGEYGVRWVMVDVLWATAAAVVIGVAFGAALAWLSWEMRSREPKHEVLDDLVGLGLIAVGYGVSASVSAWGFLTVFFIGVALRQTELKLAGRTETKGANTSKTTDAAPAQAIDPDIQASEPVDKKDAPPIVSTESLIFEEHLERLSELLLILLLGGMMFMDYWSWRTVGLALFLFFIARPVSVLLSLIGSRVPWSLQGMTAWFGVRGIGSIYYLMYAIQHGLPTALAKDMIQLTLIVITLSILLHGASVKPMMNRFWKPTEKSK